MSSRSSPCMPLVKPHDLLEEGIEVVRVDVAGLFGDLADAEGSAQKHFLRLFDSVLVGPYRIWWSHK